MGEQQAKLATSPRGLNPKTPKEHLIQNKASTGRPVDLGDIDRLK